MFLALAHGLDDEGDEAAVVRNSDCRRVATIRQFFGSQKV
jgi:hypothetical protein